MDVANNPLTDRLNALSLHLYALFFPGYYLLELTLKDKLFHLIRKQLGNHWFTQQLHADYVDSVFSSETQLILRRKNKDYQVTDDSFLLESGFGFWVEFFGPRLYKMTKGLPIQILTRLPAPIKRSDVYTTLNRIKDFRNNLYHSRIPLVSSSEHIMHLRAAEQAYQDLHHILDWLDAPHRELVDKRQFRETIREIQALLATPPSLY